MLNSKKAMTALMITLVVLMMGFNGLAQPVYTIKYVASGPADPLVYVPYTVGYVFKNLVEDRTQGRVKVDLYPAGQLGSQREGIEGVMMGTVEAASVNLAALSGFFPEMDVYGIPWLFPSEEVAARVFDGPFGQALEKEMRDRLGIRIAGGISILGYRHMTNGVRPIRTPDDLKGLKMRTMDNPTYIEMFRSLGAVPTPIAIGETYLALQMGTVDGHENPANVIESYKFYEVQKYLTLTGHVLSGQVMVMSEAYLNSMPADIREAVLDAARDAVVNVRGAAMLLDVMSRTNLAEKGMQVYMPTEAEQALFREKTQGPAVELLKKSMDPKWVDGVLQAVEDAKIEIKKEKEPFL